MDKKDDAADVKAIEGDDIVVSVASGSSSGGQKESDWGIIMPSPGPKEAPKPEQERYYNELLRAIVKRVGRDCIRARRVGALNHDYAYIKVTASQDLLEQYAEENGFEYRTTSFFGDSLRPFSRALKKQGAYVHPNCDCANNHKCKCCKFGNKKKGEGCRCEIFLPYQRQELLKHILSKCFDEWMEDNYKKTFKPGTGLQTAKREGYIIDVIPVHTLKNRTAFFNSRAHFAEEHCKGWKALATPFQFTPQSRRFLQYVRSYLGEKVSLYFAYLQFYNMWLLFLLVLGVALSIYQWAYKSDNALVPVYCVLVALWSTLFLEFWVRKSNALASHWDMQDYEEVEEELETFAAGHEDQEPQFGFYEKGGSWVDLQEWAKEKIDETPAIEHFIPRYYRNPKGKCPTICFACVPADKRESANYYVWNLFQRMFTFSVLMTLVAAVLIVTISLLLFRLVVQKANQMWGGVAAGVLNAVSIAILDAVYKIVATALNDWENHRTATQYEDSLIAKTFLFQFVNSYFSLFYIAFFKGSKVNGLDGSLFGYEDICLDSKGQRAESCMPELSNQLTSLFLSRMLIGNLTETALPWVMSRFKRYVQKKQVVAEEKQKNPNLSDAEIAQRVEKQLAERASQVETEFEWPKYSDNPNTSGTFEDYNEIALQFGYVLLFAPAFPLGAAAAVLGNIVENATDTWKLMFTVQRPPYVGASDIGTWLPIFRIMSVIGVMTNCGLIAFTSSQLSEYYTTPPTLAQKFAVVVVAEHVVFGIQYVISHFVDSQPEWLRQRNARADAITYIENEFATQGHVVEELQRRQAEMEDAAALDFSDLEVAKLDRSKSGVLRSVSDIQAKDVADAIEEDAKRDEKEDEEDAKREDKEDMDAH
eukprot:TRINITY_DN4368_c0_g1_i1.p1 TRINITY_DN4368_c0_g1~~TRINITY_DN4368_c0_g1_i1.p1  ORF type:complete len:875 (+),score=361.69 TRINITY_DN4368_c0_g1_i1:82-2706(+)